jgi:HSP20 family protein
VGQLSLDIYKTDSEIVILAPIAGVSKEDIQLALTDDVLVIKGERKRPEEVSDEAYYTRECFFGAFSRAIILPLDADTKNISADFSNNLLEIRIKKMPAKTEESKIIKIKES